MKSKDNIGRVLAIALIMLILAALAGHYTGGTP